MYWRILNDQPFWTRPNDRMFMLDKVAKSNSQNKTNWYLFKLEPDSTRFSQEPTEKGQTLKGNRQSSQATHCLVKKYTVPSVTSFRTDLPRDSMRRNGWPKHKLRIVVSFVTIVQSRSRNVLSRVLRRCRLSQSLVFPLVCFTRKRLWLVSDSKINQVSSGVLGNWGNWSSCCSVRIDRRLLSHQLILLMFDHFALLTHLRFQLLQPLRKFFHPDYSDVPKHSRRLLGSAVATTSSATMCRRETERGLSWAVEDGRIITLTLDHSRSQVHMSKQLNGCQQNNTGWKQDSHEDCWHKMYNWIQRDYLKQLFFTTCVVINMQSPHQILKLKILEFYKTRNVFFHFSFWDIWQLQLQFGLQLLLRFRSENAIAFSTCGRMWSGETFKVPSFNFQIWWRTPNLKIENYLEKSQKQQQNDKQTKNHENKLRKKMKNKIPGKENDKNRRKKNTWTTKHEKDDENWK